MTYLFQDLHGVFISSFGSPEMYLYHADKYYQVRNALSHQASTIITVYQSTKVDTKNIIFKI